MGWSLLLAAIARWPCIPYVDAAPLDPNFGLHALSAAPFSGNHPFKLTSLSYPDGISAQFIAIPTLLMAKSFCALCQRHRRHEFGSVGLARPSRTRNGPSFF